MISTLERVVSDVPEDSTIYLGNFGAQLFSVGHELIAQGRSGLRVIAPSGGILVDQLIGAGTTDAIVVSHCWNPIGPAPTRNFVREVSAGRIHVTELSFGAITSALIAAAWRVPFMPTSDLSETAYVAEDRSGGLLAVAECRLGHVPVVAAIRPDIAFIHVDQATVDGDAMLAQPAADALAAAQAAQRVVLIAERIVDRLPRPADIAGLVVHSVVEHPGAVWPDGAAGHYERDVTAYIEYADLPADRDSIGIWWTRTTERWNALHG
jgi:glutaconate CoA-transferase subunit A